MLDGRCVGLGEKEREGPLRGRKVLSSPVSMDSPWNSSVEPSLYV